jgi:hypothetical protein
MKKLLVSLTLFIAVNTTVYSQSNHKKDKNMLNNEIIDRIALKNIVDTFSILADQKETTKQTLLFTEDAKVESIINGKHGSSFTGRKEIGEAFSSFLSLFQTVYHINGQQSVTINGEKASGISYCLVTLIGMENGVKIKTTMGVYYNDNYVKKDNAWLIQKRVSNFVWQEKSKVE